MVYLLGEGGPRCIAADDLVAVPAEFIAATARLSRDLRLALDCFLAFGGVPRKVVNDVLINIDAAHTGFDLAARGASLDHGKAAH